MASRPSSLGVADGRAGTGPHGPLALEVDGLGVEYKLHLTKRTTIRKSVASMLELRRAGPRKFWALRAFSLHARPGEVIAVIGPNGAGKTTLLQVLAGIIPPTEGTATVRGEVNGFLGPAGFDPDLSGRENIALLGALLAVEADEIRDRTEAIIAFADLGNFIDAPVRTYSFGMRARLGFSIVSLTEPDIVLLDEIVSTGDEEYRARSKAQLRQTIRNGRVVVLVTHDMQWVVELCARALLIEHGRLVADGSPADLVALYRERAGSGVPSPSFREFPP
jgi:ABC-2 type transport system ATP-binding protein